MSARVLTIPAYLSAFQAAVSAMERSSKWEIAVLLLEEVERSLQADVKLGWKYWKWNLSKLPKNCWFHLKFEHIFHGGFHIFRHTQMKRKEKIGKLQLSSGWGAPSSYLGCIATSVGSNHCQPKSRLKLT